MTLFQCFKLSLYKLCFLIGFYLKSFFNNGIKIILLIKKKKTRNLNIFLIKPYFTKVIIIINIVLFKIKCN